MRGAALIGISALCIVSAAGCAADEEQVIPPVVLGMLETTAPTYDDGQMQIYEVHVPVELPLRRPTEEEQTRGESPPYPRPPFHLASDTKITARFTISNLDNAQHTVELLVDPWNEFRRYVPGVSTVAEEETVPNFSGIDRFFILKPLERIEGIVTPDDFRELARDLGTAMTIAQRPPAEDSPFAGAALYNRAFNIQNRSSEPDPVLAPFFPPVVAGIVGFDLGLRTYEQAKIAIEVVLDVDDEKGDRVIPEGDDARRVGRPGQTLSPPAGGGPM